jgi:hypothetical protein
MDWMVVTGSILGFSALAGIVVTYLRAVRG